MRKEPEFKGETKVSQSTRSVLKDQERHHGASAQIAAAARTAEAVEKLVAVQGQQAAAREENKGLSGALYKVLKPPEVWKPENREQEHAAWQALDFAFKAYLVALDEGFQNDFAALKQNPGVKLKMDEMEDGTKKRGTILYAGLTSQVQGRPQKVLKSIQPGNGFECYRVLAEQATPQLIARALALLQSILQYSFSRTATLTGNFQRLDDLVKEYEGASGCKEVGDDILVGVLLKNPPAQGRSWLLVHLKEDTPYSQVREAVRSWDMQPTSELIASAIAKSTTREHLPMLSQWRWTAWKRASPKEKARKEKERRKMAKERAKTGAHGILPEVPKEKERASQKKKERWIKTMDPSRRGKESNPRMVASTVERRDIANQNVGRSNRMKQKGSDR